MRGHARMIHAWPCDLCAFMRGHARMIHAWPCDLCASVRRERLCLVLSFCLMLMQDTPDGSYAMLEKKGKKQKANLLKELLNGFTNYRIWLLAACYAYSFGVEVCLLCSC